MDKNECCNYVVSLQKPTAVQFTVVGNFRSPNELDMVMARINRIEYLLVTAEGLKPHKEIPIFGRIASLNVFRLPGEKLDSLLILTSKYHLAILVFDRNGNPKTRASGHVADKVGRPAETGIFTSIHESGLIGLRLYEGHLKLIQWQDGKDLKNFNVRFEDYNVTDVAFLQNTEIPTVAYFYQDLNGRHLKVCEIDLESRELRPAVWHQSNIEAEATLLVPIPAPYGGLVVVGQESISYQKSQSHFISVAPPHINMARFNCYGRIDRTGERFLLGDMSGRLFMLLLIKDITNKEGHEEIRDLKIELLGEISIPECIVYLDNSVVFIGSKFGDSQLIRLSTEPVETDPSSFVICMDTFTNLGPIRDLTFMDVDGQNQLICASGAFKDGSLRIIRSGIGIEEMATVELRGIKGIFTLQIDSEIDNYLVTSFVDVTHLLLFDQEELEDTQIPDFDLCKPTLWAGNFSPTRIIQINADFVQMISGDGKFHVKWLAPSRISLAATNPECGQILVASGAHLFYLCVRSDELVLIDQIECPNEIACLDISPLGNSLRSDLFSLGFWAEHSVAIYSLRFDKIQQLTEEKLSNEFLPKSLLMITMEDVHYLFVALGDGTVIRYIVDLDTGLLTDPKKFALGTQPTSLRKFTSKKQAVNIFACSDRPTVIYSNNYKLSFCNVNLHTISQMCPLNSEFYRGCLALSDGENLIVGVIDDIQKLHIRTVPLGESVSRVVYQKETNLIAVLTSRPADTLANGHRIPQNRHSISTMGTKHNVYQQQTYPSSFTPANTPQQREMACTGIDAEVHSLCFMDANTFECLQVLELNKQEIGLSLCTAKLGNDTTPYFALGSAVSVSDETESKQGRILVIQASYIDSMDGGIKIRIITEKEVKGAVYSITTLDNKLICTVNSTVRLFEWTPERELHLECSNFNYIQALYLKTKGDLVLVGDLMRSICLLSYKPVDSTFEEIARDYSAEWTTACEIINSETFIAAETNYNLYCCKTNVSAETDEDKMRLKQVGLYFLGEQINVFQRGSIIGSQQKDSNKDLQSTNPIIYGTVDGGLGAIVQVPNSTYMFLHDLQNRIATKTHNCMRVDHSVYRSFFSERRLEAATGFLDGDLIETVVEMSRELLMKIIDGMKYKKTDDGGSEMDFVTPEDVLKIIDDLAQIY